MTNHRWRGYEHPELYEMINAGPGSRASDPQTKYWEGLTDELAIVDQDLNEKLNKIGAVWEGEAAESATAGLTPLAQWATDAQTGSSVMGISTQLQGDYIADARSNMPEPQKVTTPAPSGWEMAAAGAGMVTGNPGPAIQVAAQAADHEAQESAQADAEDKAVQTMVNYEDSSTSNRDTLGEFSAPPDVVVATPPPTGAGGGAGVQVPESNSAALALNDANQTTSSSSSPQLGGGNYTGPNGNSQLPPYSQTNPQNNLPPVQNPGPGPVQPPWRPGPTPPPHQGPPPWSVPPGPGQGDGRGPNQGGRGSNNLRFGGPGSAEDAARRGGLRGGGLPGGMGLDGENARSNSLGRGMPSGIAGENGVVGRGGPGAGTGGAGRGGVGGPMGAGGRRADGDDDDEHFSPDYLLETEEVFGDDRRVAPTVIGEVQPKK